MISALAARTLTCHNNSLDLDKVDAFLEFVTDNIRGAGAAGYYHCEVSFEEWGLNLFEIDYILSRMRSKGFDTECLDEYTRFRISW